MIQGCNLDRCSVFSRYKLFDFFPQPFVPLSDNFNHVTVAVRDKRFSFY